jgi:hypothetical protein
MLARCMDVRRRRIAVIVVGCAMALATLPAVLAGSGQTGVASGFPAAAPSYGVSATGSQFAAQVLASAPIPPGAQPWWTAAPPAALDGPLEGVGEAPLIDLHDFYLVGEPAGANLIAPYPAQNSPLDSYVLAHLPSGSSFQGSGSQGGPGGSAVFFAVSLPTSGPNESLAQLLYATSPTTGGEYLLRIDAQVVWVPDRSSADAIPVPATAQLTGYAIATAMGYSSGRVTVQLDQADSTRLAAAINALPLAPQALCMEDSLLYKITFEPQRGSGQTDQVSGGLCPKAVDVTLGATPLPPLSDAGCSVLSLVASLLPSKAAGTLGAVAYC